MADGHACAGRWPFRGRLPHAPSAQAGYGIHRTPETCQETPFTEPCCMNLFPGRRLTHAGAPLPGHASTTGARALTWSCCPPPEAPPAWRLPALPPTSCLRSAPLPGDAWRTLASLVLLSWAALAAHPIAQGCQIVTCGSAKPICGVLQRSNANAVTTIRLLAGARLRPRPVVGRPYVASDFSADGSYAATALQPLSVWCAASRTGPKLAWHLDAG